MALIQVLTACLAFGRPMAAPALEVGGVTAFVRPPQDVELISFYTNVWDGFPEDYFTVQLPDDAGASLAALTIEQTRGVDRQFPFAVERTRAFLGRPRAEGRAVPVQAQFDQANRRFQITFPQPIAPGNTVTVVLIPWTNPSQGDTYMYLVTAFPAGPNPAPASLGYGTLNIYQRQTR